MDGFWTLRLLVRIRRLICAESEGDESFPFAIMADSEQIEVTCRIRHWKPVRCRANCDNGNRFR